MPMITVEWIEGRTAEQKAKLAKRITDAMVEETNVSLDHVWIVFKDVPRSEWAMAGEILSEKAKK